MSQVELSELEKECIRFAIRVYLNAGSPAGMPSEEERQVCERVILKCARKSNG